jgi:hypothetical protein
MSYAVSCSAWDSATINVNLSAVMVIPFGNVNPSAVMVIPFGNARSRPTVVI